MLIVVSGPKVSLMSSIDLTISPSTRCVSSSISPSSVARLMNVPGAWITPSSSRRRTSASMPLMSRVRMSPALECAAEAFLEDGEPQRLLDLHALLGSRACPMPESKTARPLPAFLTRYMAMSALWRNAS